MIMELGTPKSLEVSYEEYVNSFKEWIKQNPPQFDMSKSVYAESLLGNDKALSTEMEVMPANDAKERTLKSIVSRINQAIKDQSDCGRTSVTYNFGENCSDDMIEHVKRVFRSYGYNVPNDFNQEFPDQILIDW